MAAALGRARNEGEVEEGSAGAQMREGERASGALGSSGQGRGGCELHARHVANSASSTQVIFKRRMDAEATFAGAGKINALGPALVSFRLTDFPASASGNKASHVASKSE
uniref:Uncharacterized protein n=1 Tax=Zea mays TaxID=4577 RepID=A0A804UIF4_MAIZE